MPNVVFLSAPTHHLHAESAMTLADSSDSSLAACGFGELTVSTAFSTDIFPALTAALDQCSPTLILAA